PPPARSSSSGKAPARSGRGSRKLEVHVTPLCSFWLLGELAESTKVRYVDLDPWTEHELTRHWLPQFAGREFIADPPSQIVAVTKLYHPLRVQRSPLRMRRECRIGNNYTEVEWLRGHRTAQIPNYR